MSNLEEILLNEDNREPIVLFGENGEEFTFEQVAIIPYRGEIYAILKPINKIEGVADDEAIVFRTIEDDMLTVETDEDIARIVFLKYYDLLKEHLGN